MSDDAAKSWTDLKLHERMEAVSGYDRHDLAETDARKSQCSDFSTILCATCRHGVVQRRNSTWGVRAICNAGGFPWEVPTDLDVCSRYRRETDMGMTLEEMLRVGIPVDVREAPPQKNAYL